MWEFGGSRGFSWGFSVEGGAEVGLGTPLLNQTSEKWFETLNPKPFFLPKLLTDWMGGGPGTLNQVAGGCHFAGDPELGVH